MVAISLQQMVAGEDTNEQGNTAMHLGMIGLGRMGGNIVRRLTAHGHHCVVYDRARAAVDALAAEGSSPASGLADMVAQLPPRRIVWVMLPAGKITDDTVAELGGQWRGGWRRFQGAVAEAGGQVRG